MSSIRVTVDGEIEPLLRRLRNMAAVDKRGVMAAIGEGLRSSTMDRFDTERTPEGAKWQSSIRAAGGGKTLTQTGALRGSIRVSASSAGVSIGTNDIRAATHQFGATRTIRAKNKKYLTFRYNGRWCKVKSVRITIPARPYLGLSNTDMQEIKETLEAALEE